MALDEKTIGSLTVTPTWHRSYQLVWSIAMLVGIVIFIAALPGYILKLPASTHTATLVATPTNLDIGVNLLTSLISITSVLLSLVLSWLLFRHNSSEFIVAFVSIYLIVYAAGYSGPLELAQLVWFPKGLNVYDFVTAIIMGPMSIALITLFPDGRFVPSWGKWLVVASLPMIPLSIFYTELLQGGVIDFKFWIAVTYALLLFLTGLGTQIYRYRNVSRQIEKQQIKWVFYGTGLWVSLITLSSIPYTKLQLLPAGSPLPWWVSFGALLWTVSLTLLPLSLSISVLKFRLYDVDIIINRTLVYSVLTAIVLILYVMIVSILGALFQGIGNTLIALSGTAVIAVLVNPLRIRLQREANRMMFGDRDEPYEVVRRLGRRLESSAEPTTILPAIVETVTQTLKIPFAQITLLRGDRSYLAATRGKQVGEMIRYPLAYQNETIGYLDVSQRNKGESLSEADKAIIRQIARQAGPSIQAVRLTQDLQASRVNLVTAREEERRRLRRDLHDGLGPVIASQGLKMAAASQLLRDDPQRAQELLDELAQQNESTVAEIRRLVYDLRPATLDDLGLAGALKDYALQFTGLNIIFDLPEDGLQFLPAALEVALYRIASEAITNVSRHARASECIVVIHIAAADSKYITLQVSDNGIGIPKERHSGIGLTSMRERAEEIGGEFEIRSFSRTGATLVARLPLGPE